MSKLIFCLLIVFSAHAQSDTTETVTLPRQVALWYLEQARLAELLQYNDSIKSLLIVELENKLLNQQRLIDLYIGESELYTNIIETKNRQLYYYENMLTRCQKRTDNQRKLFYVLSGALFGTLVGCYIDHPVSGMLVGAVGGFALTFKPLSYDKRKIK